MAPATKVLTSAPSLFYLKLLFHEDQFPLKWVLRIASWTWDVTHERALSPADLFGGKAPVGALIGLLERIR